MPLRTADFYTYIEAEDVRRDGLVDRFFDASKTRRGHVYEASPLGGRALDLVQRMETYLKGQLRA